MISYQQVHPTDIDEIEALYRKYLDNGSDLRERIDRIIEKPDIYTCKAVDTLTNRIIGIAIYDTGIVLSCGHPEIVERIAGDIGSDALCYTGESLLVEREYRSRDISYGMNDAIRRSFMILAKERQKPVWVLHEMWVYPDGKTPAARVVQTVYGITIDYGVIPDFYRDYYKHGHLCPICGRDCRCSARITLSKIEPAM